MHGPLPFACKPKDSPQALLSTPFTPLAAAPTAARVLVLLIRISVLPALLSWGLLLLPRIAASALLLAAVSLVLAALLIILVHLSSYIGINLPHVKNASIGSPFRSTPASKILVHDEYLAVVLLYTAADVTPRREVALISLPLRGEPRDHRRAEVSPAAQREQSSRRRFRHRSEALVSVRELRGRTPIRRYAWIGQSYHPLPMSHHRRAVRVRHLEPIPRRSGPVGRRKPLRHDPHRHIKRACRSTDSPLASCAR
jgi:hypothetical protein